MSFLVIVDGAKRHVVGTPEAVVTMIGSSGSAHVYRVVPIDIRTTGLAYLDTTTTTMGAIHATHYEVSRPSGRRSGLPRRHLHALPD